MTDPPHSQHPADRLIRDLIATGRDASDDDLHLILDRIATAPFSKNLYKVPVEHRGQLFDGRALGAREPSLRYHLFKRVVMDRQWATYTSEQHYLNDLHAVARAPGCRLGIYERQAGAIAVAASSTRTAIPARRLGSKVLPLIVVVYSADRGTLISGYQFSDLAELSIPEDAKWYGKR